MQSIFPVHTHVSAVDTGSVVTFPGALLPPLQALKQGFELEQLAPSPVPGILSIAETVPRPFTQPQQEDAAHLGQHNRQGFCMGDVGIMVGYQDSSELTEMPNLYYLPHTPEWFLGMVNLHGNMVPVFDLAAYLGVARNEKARKHMLLVLAHGEDAAGIVIDEMPQRLQWSDQQQTYMDTAPDLLAPHISSACLIGNRLWFDLQTASLLEALEHGMMASSA